MGYMLNGKDVCWHRHDVCVEPAYVIFFAGGYRR